MERDFRPITVTLSPERFVALCRCVKDDFETRYAYCLEQLYEDNSADLDAMEEDIDLLEGVLPHLGSESTDETIRGLIADFKRKLAEVA